MMARIKNLVVFGFFAVLMHDLHAQQSGAGSINCAPGTDNFDFPNAASGLPAATATRTSTLSITATGTVTLRIMASGVPATATLTLTQGGNAVAGAPTTLAAWGAAGAQVTSGTYSLAVLVQNPGVGVLDPYYVVAGISDGSGGCVESLYYGMIGAGSGTQNFGTAPASPLTTCGGGGGGGGGGGANTGIIAGPGSGNAPPNNKDRFKVLINTGGRRLVVGQIQGNNFTSFGGLGSFNARNALRHGDKLRLFYVPMIPISTVSAGGCCVSAFTGGSNNNNGGSGNRAVVVRTRVSRGSGRVSHHRR